MLRLGPDKIRALSERLRDRGSPNSVAFSPGGEDPETAMLLLEYGPLCEVMFLAMSADGAISQAERDVLRGALRELDDRIRTTHFGAMLRKSEESLVAEGNAARLRAVAKQLNEDPVRAEVGYILASAVAYADKDMSMAENDFLNDLADALAIDDARSEELQRLLL